jgi:hypothetical protein
MATVQPPAQLWRGAVLIGMSKVKRKVPRNEAGSMRFSDAGHGRAWRCLGIASARLERIHIPITLDEISNMSYIQPQP